MLELIVLVGAGIAGFVGTRDFTRRKLRFVDAVHSRSAPVIAGVIAGIAVAPLAILPIITIPAAAALGVGVGLGVRSAQKDRHLLP